MLNIPALFVYLLATAVGWIIGKCSRSFLRKTAVLFGNVMYIFPCFGKLCLENVMAAFPEKSREEAAGIAKESLQNLVLTVLEFFWIRQNPDKLCEIVDTEGSDAVAAEGLKKIGEGKGAILVTPHLGNWEFSGRILAQVYKYKMATVVRSTRNPYLDKLVSGSRSSGGDVEIIYSKGGAKAMNIALKSGKTLGILIDQNVKLRHGGIFVNMFGMPVPVSRAPAALGRTQDRFFAVGATLRKKDGSMASYLKTLPKPAKEYESDEELIQALTELSEEFIRMAPEQYLWMYKRFQYIPHGTPEEIVKKYPPYAKFPNKHFYTNNPLELGKRKK